MSALYEAKLGRTIDGIGPPDYRGSLVEGPSDDFVLSFRLDGTPASRFGDLVWDFTAYHPEQRNFGFHFAYWGDTHGTPEQIDQSRIVRRVMFSLIWHRNGASLALGTLANYLTVLGAAARHADELCITLGTLFGDATRLPAYATTICSGWMCETLGSLLSGLKSIEKEALGFEVVPSKTIRVIKACGQAYRRGIKQHAPIPSRLYSALIEGLGKELDKWNAISKDTLKLLQACGADPFMGRGCDVQSRSSFRKLGVQPVEFRPNFADMCPASVANYLATVGKAANVKSLSYVVGEIQLVCKLIIQTFTGMRDDEACSLPYHCLDTTAAHGKVHCVVKGRTTKFNHGLPKRARWVTNREGQQAILAAQAIADAIYNVYGVIPEDSSNRRSRHPLFPSLGYMNLAAKRMVPVDGHFVPGTLEFRPGSRLPDLLFAAIEERDIRELEQIDPHRAWRSELAFRLGKPWSFKTHQLRRSLALYAQRSGLVSLPSLRRQLQHITEEMSRYYAKGSAFAKDFIGEESSHFGLEWQATQSESAGLGYILNVLMSDDTLTGGHARWVEHRLKAADGAVLIDREATMRRFKKGEMAYKETLLGGCTSVEECNQSALKWLSIDCLRDGCKNLVCSLSKLELVVAAQERLVATIDPHSVEYRTEVADLHVLRGAMESANERNIGEPK